jgi:FMN reductase
MSAVVLLSGSPSASPSSRANTLLRYTTDRLKAAGLEVISFGVRDFPAEDLILGKYDSPSFAELHRRTNEAAAIVVLTPVYKAAYSGGLKTILDMLPQTALRGKTVLPLVMGGSPAHQLVIDYALKPVLSALGATDLLQGVYLVDAQVSVNEQGELVVTEELRERLDRSIERIVAAARGRAIGT